MDVRGKNRVSQINCILDRTCNKNFDGEFEQPSSDILVIEIILVIVIVSFCLVILVII